MKVSSEDLIKLELLATAATQGRWVVDASDVGARFNVETADGKTTIAMSQEIYRDTGNKQREANADFIAMSDPVLVLAMVEELKAYRAREAIDEPSGSSKLLELAGALAQEARAMVGGADPLGFGHSPGASILNLSERADRVRKALDAYDNAVVCNTPA